MGLLLQRAQNEAMNGNLEAKASLKQLGSIYLHNREILAPDDITVLSTASIVAYNIGALFLSFALVLPELKCDHTIFHGTTFTNF